ncbi:MAG: hypothetical protein K8F27_11960 [Sulfuricellaceae bacterium]|nr:hypothetical protein [Sulfuricellaceae bacterium]
MLEYIFFDEELCERFARYAGGLGVACQSRADALGMVVAVAEDLAEDLDEKLEQFYEQLQQEQSAIADSSAGGLKVHAAGIRATLPGGRSCMIKLEADMANRLLSCFTLDEVQELVSIIARSVENPDEKPICRT